MLVKLYHKIRKLGCRTVRKNNSELRWTGKVWLELRLAGSVEKKASTVLFFPGTMASPWQYSYLLDEIQLAGLNVVSPHFPGHGYCRKEAVLSFAKMLALGLDAEEWLLRHGLGPVVVAGHSQGAIQALGHAGASWQAKAAFPISAIFPQMPEAIEATRFASQARKIDKLLAFINTSARILPFLPIPWFVYLQSSRIKKGSGKILMPAKSMRSSYPLAFLASLFSAKIAEQANCPVWLINAKDDALFTPALTWKIFARLQARRKTMVWLESGGHLAAVEHYGSKFVARRIAAACSSIGLPINLMKKRPGK